MNPRRLALVFALMSLAFAGLVFLSIAADTLKHEREDRECQICPCKQVFKTCVHTCVTHGPDVPPICYTACKTGDALLLCPANRK